MTRLAQVIERAKVPSKALVASVFTLSMSCMSAHGSSEQQSGVEELRSLKLLVLSGSGQKQHGNEPGGLRDTMRRLDSKDIFDYASFPEGFLDTDVVVYLLKNWDDAINFPNADGAFAKLVDLLRSKEPSTFLALQSLDFTAVDDQGNEIPKKLEFLSLNVSTLGDTCTADDVARELLDVFDPTNSDADRYDYAILKDCVS